MTLHRPYRASLPRTEAYAELPPVVLTQPRPSLVTPFGGAVPAPARDVGASVARAAELRAAFAPFVPAEAVTWGDALNHHFRQHGEHLYVYDAETLEARLHAAGFVEPRVVPSSRDYEQPARDFESLVVVARNP